MRHILLTSAAFLCVACGHTYDNSREFENEFKNRQQQKNDTLIVSHHECTECLDLYIDKGKLTIPSDIFKELKMLSDKDIKVCGHFPMDLIDPTTFNFDPNQKFKIIGKVIKADTANAIGTVPLFYVDNWTKF